MSCTPHYEGLDMPTCPKHFYLTYFLTFSVDLAIANVIQATLKMLMMMTMMIHVNGTFVVYGSSFGHMPFLTPPMTCMGNGSLSYEDRVLLYCIIITCYNVNVVTDRPAYNGQTRHNMQLPAQEWASDAIKLLQLPTCSSSLPVHLSEWTFDDASFITGRMPRSGKLPVLDLLTGQKSGFSPRRGDSLLRFRSNFAGPTGTWVRLAVQNFTSIDAGGWECGPKNIKISTFW